MVRMQKVTEKNLKERILTTEEIFEKNLQIIVDTLTDEWRDVEKNITEYLRIKNSGKYRIKYYYIPSVGTYIFTYYRKDFGFKNEQGTNNKNGLEYPRKEDA